MVGIVDPPRPEATDAIAKCKSAGIQVRMITGDHAVTAAAIGRELGIEGRALTGARVRRHERRDSCCSDLPDIGVIARVAPEDKIRLVQLLQQQENIVAMTGDGVNDAPALKKADIGVAMGITGTEVSKEAAVMILTDDNFATIVKAVEFGRGIYDNLAKYIRFQMAALVAFILSYLGAAIFTILGGVPFQPLVVLWINFLVQVPIAIALGFDKPSPGLMERKPRPLKQPVLNRAPVGSPDLPGLPRGARHACHRSPLRIRRRGRRGDARVCDLRAVQRRDRSHVPLRDRHDPPARPRHRPAPARSLRHRPRRDRAQHRAVHHATHPRPRSSDRRPMDALRRLRRRAARSSKRQSSSSCAAAHTRRRSRSRLRAPAAA